MPSIFSKIYPAVCISLLCAIVSVAPAHAAILTTSLSSTSVTTGQQFTLDVIVSGLDAGQAVAGFDLDLVFDPALLTADHATFGNYLGTVDVDQFTNALLSPGRADFAAVSMSDGATLLSRQPGMFSLARFVFNATGPGSAAIDFDTLAAPGLLLSDQFGNAIAVSASYGASVDVAPATAVPEPSSVALLMAGALMAFVRRARTPPGRRPAR
jgi:hypothetical protein